MSISTAELLALPPAEQLRIVEMLWDHLGESTTEIPLPAWIDEEGVRRLKEMKADSSLGLDHEAVWKQIELRNG